LKTNDIRLFARNGIYEVLLSTGFGDETNVSPVGLHARGTDLKIFLYKSTKSYEILVRNPKCGITISFDARKFYMALKGELNNQVRFSKNGFPFLEGDAVLLAECLLEKDEDPAAFKVVPHEAMLNIVEFPAFNRANALLIDALVHLTRLPVEEPHTREALRILLIYELSTAKRLAPELADIVDEIVDQVMKAYKL